MAGAEWVRWSGAAMFAALTLFAVSRLLASGPEVSARSVNGSRSVMSLGMVVMLVPQLDPLPRLCWQVLFGLMAGYLTLRLMRLGGHHELHLVVGALAMVYMFAAMPAGHEMVHGMTTMDTVGMDTVAVGTTGIALPALTWAFVVYFLVFVVWLSARLAVPASGGETSTPRNVLASPHLSGSSEVVMGIGMSYMLVTML